MLLDCKNLNPNTVNLEDGSTTFGRMFYQAGLESDQADLEGYKNNYIKRGFKPDELIKLVHKKCGSKLDLNKPQIYQRKFKGSFTNKLFTPIAIFIERMRDYKW